MKNYYVQRSKSRTLIIYVVIKGEKTTRKISVVGYKQRIRLGILIQHYKIKPKEKGKEKVILKSKK